MEDDKRHPSLSDLEMLQDTPDWEWPPAAPSMLLSCLRNPEASEQERLLAAELAGQYTVINDEIVHELLAIVDNREAPDELRGTAAIAFGAALEGVETELEDDPESCPIGEDAFDRIRETLARLYRDAGTPKLVRRRALEAAVRSPEDWQQDAVRQAWSSGDEEWRLTAVFGMRYVQGFEDEIVQSLTSGNEDIQYEAVCAAGEWGVTAAWPHIRFLLRASSIDKELLLAAIEAAGNVNPEEAPEDVAPFLHADDEDISETAMCALEMMRGAQDMGEELEDEEDMDFEDEDEDEPIR